jgi:hypothetical protein
MYVRMEIYFLQSAMAIMVAIMSLDLVASTCDSSNYCCDSSSTYTVPTEASQAWFMCCIHPVGDTYTYAASDCPAGTSANDNGVYIQCCLDAPSYNPSTISTCSDSTCETSQWNLCGCEEDGAVCSISGYDTYFHTGCILQNPSGSTFTCPNGWRDQSFESNFQCITTKDYTMSPPPTAAPTRAPTYAPGAPTPEPTPAICETVEELACANTAFTPVDYSPAYCILRNPADSSSCPSGWTYDPDWDGSPACEGQYIVNLKDTGIAACTQSSDCLNPLTVCGFASDSDLPSGFDVYDITFTSEVEGGISAASDCPEGYTFNGDDGCSKQVSLDPPTPTPTMAPTGICSSAEEMSCATSAVSTFPGEAFSACILHNVSDSTSCPSGWIYLASWSYISKPFCYSAANYLSISTGIVACTQSSSCLDPLTYCGFGSTSGIPSGFNVNNLEFLAYADTVTDPSDCPEGWDTAYVTSNNMCTKHVYPFAPTPAPTEFPTLTGQSTSEAITFGVSQSLSGLSKTDWDSNEADNLAVFKAATAQLLGCAESDIDNVVVADSSRRRLAISHEVEDARALSTSSVTITYDVVLQVASGESSSDVYTAAVNVIVDSTASGCSTNCLATVIAEVAEAKGVSSADIVSATVTAVSSSDVGSAMTITIPAPTASPTVAPSDDDTWMTTEVIAGIAGVAVVLVVCCGVGACMLGLFRKSSVKPDHAQEDTPFVKGGRARVMQVAPTGEVPLAEEVYEI